MQPHRPEWQNEPVRDVAAPPQGPARQRGSAAHRPVLPIGAVRLRRRRCCPAGPVGNAGDATTPP
eukprot:2712787-Alexandrium_andersonii.AAC.1